MPFDPMAQRPGICPNIWHDNLKIMCKYIKSCCTPYSNTMLYVNYMSIKLREKDIGGLSVNIPTLRVFIFHITFSGEPSYVQGCSL